MYECHVTIKYVYPMSSRYDELNLVSAAHGFRVAKLYKWNKKESDLDTFMTAHDSGYAEIKQKMSELVKSLYDLKFHVTRYKIEQILLDSKNGDSI